MLISGHLAGMRKINKLLKQALKLFKQNDSPQMTLSKALCEGNGSAHVWLVTGWKSLALRDQSKQI